MAITDNRPIFKFSPNIRGKCDKDVFVFTLFCVDNYEKKWQYFWIRSKNKYQQLATTSSSPNFDSLSYSYPKVRWQFCFVLFCFVLFCFVLFCFVWFVCFFCLFLFLFFHSLKWPEKMISQFSFWWQNWVFQQARNILKGVVSIPFGRWGLSSYQILPPS